MSTKFTLPFATFSQRVSVIEAATSLGIPFLKTANDPESPPVACHHVDVSIDEKGRRQSTFDAFLPYELAVRRQGNLFICPDVAVSKLDVESTETGPRAVGVYFQHSRSEGGNGLKQFHVSARKEIVVCAGAIASPQILLLR